MRGTGRLLMLFLACLPFTLADAQTLDDHERVLIPVLLPTGGRAGASGSVWETRLFVLNAGPSTVTLLEGHRYGCRLPECGDDPIDVRPSETIEINVAQRPPQLGRLLYLPREASTKVWFRLEVREESTKTTTEFPVIRESELLRGEIVLPKVEIKAGERLDLRVYDPEPNGNLAADVTISDAASGEVVATTTMRTVWTPTIDPQPEIQNIPGFAAIADLRSTVLNDYVGSVTIKISVNPDKAFWAYANSTDNVTHRITLFTPQ